MEATILVGTALGMSFIAVVGMNEYAEYDARRKQLNEIILKQINSKVEETGRVWSPREIESLHAEYKEDYLRRYDQWKKRMTAPSMFRRLKDAFLSARCSNCECKGKSSDS